jgi:hypothetical protein
MTLLQKRLVSMEACEEARTWVAERTLKQAWAECDNPSWMFWFAARMGVDRKLIVEAACQCAEAAVGAFTPEGEERPWKAIETARAWIHGEATIQQVSEAADAAYASASDVYAADAADAAYASAYAAYSAAYSAYSAAYAAAYDVYASADAIQQQSITQCADIIRGVITLQDIPKELP